MVGWLWMLNRKLENRFFHWPLSSAALWNGLTNALLRSAKPTTYIHTYSKLLFKQMQISGCAEGGQRSNDKSSTCLHKPQEKVGKVKEKQILRRSWESASSSNDGFANFITMHWSLIQTGWQCIAMVQCDVMCQLPLKITLFQCLNFFNPQTMHIKSFIHNSITYYVSLKNSHPGGIRTRDFCSWGGLRWSLRNAVSQLTFLLTSKFPTSKFPTLQIPNSNLLISNFHIANFQIADFQFSRPRCCRIHQKDTLPTIDNLSNYRLYIYVPRKFI
jgi:hypothetical protein